MSELATKIAIARYGLKQRFQDLQNCVKKNDTNLFLLARDAYFEYVRNDFIFEKILGKDLESGIMLGRDLTFEERLNLDFGNLDEIKNDFDAISHVHDILLEGLNEALSCAGFHEEKIGKKGLQSETKEIKQTTSKGGFEKIKNILVVKESRFSKTLIIINNRYKDAIEIKGEQVSEHIKALAMAIINGNDIIETDNPKQCRDFLNSNSGCRLYKTRDGKSQKYSLTKIAKFNSRFSGKKLEVANEIKTGVISFAAYQRRLNDHFE